MASTQLDDGGPLDTNTVSRALAPVPELARAFDALWDALWTQPHVPATVLELCRLRIAQMHGALAELGIRNPHAVLARIDDTKVHALLKTRSAAGRHFTDADRAALEFAEMHSVDPASVSEEIVEEVRGHFGEKGLVALVEALGFIDARIRVARMLSQLRAEMAGSGDAARSRGPRDSGVTRTATDSAMRASRLALVSGTMDAIVELQSLLRAGAPPHSAEDARLVAAFAETYRGHPQRIDARLRTELARAFTPAQLCHTILDVACFDALSKCAVSLDGTPHDIPRMR